MPKYRDLEGSVEESDARFVSFIRYRNDQDGSLKAAALHAAVLSQDNDATHAQILETAASFYQWLKEIP